MKWHVKQTMATVGGVFIFILAVIAFLFVPATGGSWARSGVKNLGSWDGIELTNEPESNFTREYASINRIAENYGFYPEEPVQRQIMEYRVLRIAFESAVVKLAAKTSAEKTGFVLTDSALNKQLINYYLGTDGVYSPQLYRNTPESVRLARKNEVSEQLIAQQYFRDLFGTGDGYFGLKVSSAELDFVKNMAKKERAFKYAVIPETIFPADKIIAYGKEHADLFAQLHLSLLTFSTEEEAKKTLASLEKKDISFEDAVLTASTKQGTDDTGLLLNSYRSDVNALFPEASVLDAVLKLAVGATSGVLKTADGYAIVRKDALETPAQFDEKSIQDKVFMNMLKNDKGIVEDFMLKKGEALITAVRSGSDFTTEAEKEGLSVVESRPVSLNYGDSPLLPTMTKNTDANLTPALTDKNFFTEAFSLKKGELSKPLIIGSNVVVLQLVSEEDTAESVLSTTADTYRTQVSTWYDQYPIFLLLGNQLPLGSQTLIDSILKSKQFTDTFSNLYK